MFVLKPHKQRVPAEAVPPWLGFGETCRSPNSTQINDSLPHNIGRYPHTNSYYFNGYLANIHFIDGEALEPSSFGELISDVWRPASYSGDYGVNGFHLDFDPDNMVYDSNGKLTQVKDASGNDNHWTAN